jgi:hypothetical protein
MRSRASVTSAVADQPMTYDVADRRNFTADRMRNTARVVGSIWRRVRRLLAHSRKKSRILAALIATTAALTLSACFYAESLPDGPIAISRGEDGIRLAVCESIVVSELFLGEHAEGDDAKELWDLFPAVGLQSGVSYSQADLVGDAGLSPEPTMDAGATIQILLTSSNAAPTQATFDIGPDGLPPGTWLHPDGATSSVPCP